MLLAIYILKKWLMKSYSKCKISTLIHVTDNVCWSVTKTQTLFLTLYYGIIQSVIKINYLRLWFVINDCCNMISDWQLQPGIWLARSCPLGVSEFNPQNLLSLGCLLDFQSCQICSSRDASLSPPCYKIKT